MKSSVVPVRLAKSFLLAFVIVYLVICIGMALGQRLLIYHPRVCDSAQVDQLAQAAHLER